MKDGELLLDNDPSRFVVLRTHEQARRLGNGLGQLGMHAQAKYLSGQLDLRGHSYMGDDAIHPPIHFKRDGLPTSLVREVLEA